MCAAFQGVLDAQRSLAGRLSLLLQTAHPPTLIVLHRLSRYLKSGEAYFDSAFGFGVNLWDGTAHWVIYLVMIYGLASPNPAVYRPVYLYWAGSILVSLALLLPAGFVGNHSHNVQASTALNIPYVLFPLLFLKRVLDTPRVSKPVARAPAVLEVMFAAFFAIVALITFVRFAAAAGSEWDWAVQWRQMEGHLDEPSRFFHLFAYMGHFYLVPVYVVVVICLLVGASTSQAAALSDILLLVAGGVAESTFTFVVSATHPKLGEHIVKDEHLGRFYTVNAVLVLGIHLAAILSLKLRLFNGLLA